MSSTIRDTVASFDFDAGGGGGVDLGEESVAVAKNLELVAALGQLRYPVSDMPA
jgi:hypothetical protein